MKIENNILIKVESSDIDSDGKCVIPYGVTVIGEAVFRDAPIKSVIIPNSVVKIEGRAFQYCDLTEITIPNSVKEIEEYAFDQCDSLKAVHITDIVSWCNTDFKGGHSNPLACAHRLYLNGELIKKLIIPDNITVIKDGVFEGGSFSEVIIPDSVTDIEDWAFYNCKLLKSMIIPSSVKNIGESVFGCCNSLSEVVIEGELNHISVCAFNSCNHLNQIIVPSKSTKNLIKYSYDGKIIVDASLNKGASNITLGHAFLNNETEEFIDVQLSQPLLEKNDVYEK